MTCTHSRDAICRVCFPAGYLNPFMAQSCVARSAAVTCPSSHDRPESGIPAAQSDRRSWGILSGLACILAGVVLGLALARFWPVAP